MKNIYKTLAAGTTLAAALVLGSCNNAEEIKKQTAEQDAKIQALVDAKFNDLQTQTNSACSAKVDSLAMAQFTAWEEENAHHGGGAKHKPKTEPKKPTAVTPAAPAAPSNTNRAGTNQNAPATNTNRAGTNTSAPASNTSRGGATVVPH